VSDEKWYIVSTVRDGDTFEDHGGPLGILGSWTREEANEKAERLRAKNLARCFRVEHESAFIETGGPTHRRRPMSTTYRHAVIVSSYNRPTMVREALQSIMFQRANVQVIVADDDSNEETRHAIEAEIRGRPSYRAIYANRPREGEFANITRRATQCINDALALVDAEFVHYLPDDDWYGSGRFFAFERFFDAHPDADVAYGRMVHVQNGEHEPVTAFVPCVKEDPARHGEFGVDHGQFCHRARVLERVPAWPAAPYFAFDANFFRALLGAGYRFYPVNRVVNYKTRHAGNLMELHG
jgi:glycosyltransferase involved in cell wall biosynthesis